MMRFYIQIKVTSAYIDKITFLDGVVWDSNQIALLVQSMSEETKLTAGLSTFESLSENNKDYASFDLGYNIEKIAL